MECWLNTPRHKFLKKDTRQQFQLAAAADGILIFPCARISPDVNIRPDMLARRGACRQRVNLLYLSNRQYTHHELNAAALLCVVYKSRTIVEKTVHAWSVFHSFIQQIKILSELLDDFLSRKKSPPHTQVTRKNNKKGFLYLHFCVYVIFLLFYSPLFFTVDIFPHSIVYSSPLEKKKSPSSLLFLIHQKKTVWL